MLTDCLAGLLHHNLIVAQGHEDELLDRTHFPNDDGAISRVLRDLPCSHDSRYQHHLVNVYSHLHRDHCIDVCNRCVQITLLMSRAVVAELHCNRLQEDTMTTL